jgi:hypothetical protein
VEPIIDFDGDERCLGFSFYRFDIGFRDPNDFIERRLQSSGVQMTSWLWSKVMLTGVRNALITIDDDDLEDESRILIGVSSSALRIKNIV